MLTETWNVSVLKMPLMGSGIWETANVPIAPTSAPNRAPMASTMAACQRKIWVMSRRS